MNAFKDRWEPFAAWVSRREGTADKSSMWQRLSTDFDTRCWPESPDEALAAPGTFRGYGLFTRRHDTAVLRLKRRVLEATYWLTRAASLGRSRVWQANVSGLGVANLAFHPAGLRWLRVLGLHDDWQRFCDRFEVSIHNASGIKACYVASLVRPHIGHRPQPRLIEVGGGLGNVAAITHFQIPLFQYVVVDLPEMLLHSSLALRAFFPDVPCHFLYPGSRDSYARDTAGFYFCAPECADQLTDGTFDVGCNIDSFQEMTETQVASYLALLQRTLMDGASLITLNRRKYLEAEGYDNNPLLYPYDPRNEVVRWETDVFMDRVYNLDRVRLDGWLLRIERILKPATVPGHPGFHGA